VVLPRQHLLHHEHLRRQRLITSGSAALPEKLGRRLEALCGQYPLERYGMTEVGIVLGNPLDAERLPGSVGRALPRCHIRIVDEAGRDVRGEAAPGQPGEIWIAAPSVFQGYDRDAAATSGFRLAVISASMASGASLPTGPAGIPSGRPPPGGPPGPPGGTAPGGRAPRPAPGLITVRSDSKAAKGSFGSRPCVLMAIPAQ